MSQTTSAASQTISLPKGGGALQGLGEKFSPDLHTGTGNFTVPIALPSGRHGFQPALNLVYSTGHGNGPFGLGWSLSLPGISRQTSKGVPRYDDAQDIFILSGAEDLVAIPTELPGRKRYRPRTEGLFARIEHHRDPSNDYWEVRGRDRLVSLYGTPATAGSDPATLADPENRNKVFFWKLTQTTDPFGNRIVYDYERDAGAEGSQRWDQLYLRRVRYVDYLEDGHVRFLVSVTFAYEDRPDPYSEHRAGFEIRTRRRCTHIEVRTHADVERLVRTYRLSYLDQQPNTAPASPPNGVSLLSRVEVLGHDGDRTEAMPPLTFGYTRFTPEQRRFSPVQGTDLPARTLADGDLALVDLFGSGLADIMQMNGTVRYWRNLGAGRFDRPRDMCHAPAGVHLADAGVQILDAAGDGRSDLLVTTATQSGYFPLRFGGLWDRRSFRAYRQAPSFDLEDPEVRLVDLDGDGVTDAIRSGSRLECFFSDPQQGWHDTRLVERRALEQFPNVSFSDPRVKLGDMTGDGLQDIALVYDGGVEYWPALGRGDWGGRVTMRHNPRLPQGYDPRRILLGDVDGDGLDDIVYVDDGKVTLWINQGGRRWSAPIEIKGTPRLTDVDAVRLVDLLGTGISGVLWSTETNGQGRSQMYFLDFTGGVKPYLLNEVDNHMGAITRINYASSTHFYLEDERRPETRWRTPLPFPVQVVARVEVVDAISKGKLSTEYRYHHGYWDGAEREFRGFGRVDQRDTEVFEDFVQGDLHGASRAFAPMAERVFSPPTETRTWFHQGPIGDEFGDWQEIDYRAEYWSGDPPALTRPQTMVTMLQNLPRRARRDALRALRGSALRTELYALDGSAQQERPYTVTEALYGVREETPPEPGAEERLRIFFPHLLTQRTTQWERGSDPMTQVTFTADYDAYGQPGSQTAIAVPRGRDFRVEAAAGEPYLVTHTATTYAHRDDAQRYLIGLVARTSSYEILNDGSPSVSALQAGILHGSAARRLIGQALNFYDGPAFQGLPCGQIGEHGVLTRTESLVLTEEILHEAYKSGDAVQTPPEIPPYLVPESPLTGSDIPTQGDPGARVNPLSLWERAGVREVHPLTSPGRPHPTPLAEGEGTPHPLRSSTDPSGWTADYPQEFRDLLPPLAGYIFQPGGEDSPYARGYFAASVQHHYDCQEAPGAPGRGLLRASRDALGRETGIDYDAYALLPVKATDPAGLSTTAVHDYRVLQAREVVDPNGNRTVLAYTPLGMLERLAVMGKAGEAVGDTLDVPGTQFVYDFLAFVERRQPIAVRTIRRLHHVHDDDVPLPERHETTESVEYSDGFGRLVQMRALAEDLVFGDDAFGDVGLPLDQSNPNGEALGRPVQPGELPRVVVSGWQQYDNKGRVVECYEPFFSRGFDYAPPEDAQFGQKVSTHYDPRGQVVRTVNPDGSEQRVIFGVPMDLSNPDQFIPTPWETYTYDANDNAGRTHPGAMGADVSHWNTPVSSVLDALGRTISSVVRNGPNPEADWHTTGSTYDIQGNLLTVRDELGRVAFSHLYDLAKQPLRSEQLDAGVRRLVLDALGTPVEERDAKGALTLQAYDVLQRPIRRWARDAHGEQLTLRERLLYGDAAESGLTPMQASAMNLLGKLYQHYDEAGLLVAESYDFKGNLLEKARQVIGDAAILAVFDGAPAHNWQIQAFRVDWHPPQGATLAQHAGELLEAQAYRTSTRFDALNRVTFMRYPQDVTGQRRELRPAYNRAGGLERVSLDGEPFVEHIAYDARGQRLLVAYGNGLMTRYAYDPLTFRLARLRTEGYTRNVQTTPSPAVSYRPSGTVVQDLGYVYDPAGNVTGIRDRTPGSGMSNTPQGIDALDCVFTYDPLYRLLSASGRESDLPSPLPPWRDAPRGADPTRARPYTERYRYDPAGNLTQVQHQAGEQSFTRLFAMAPTGNRLATLSVGATVLHYAYDAEGNLLQEDVSRHYEWDHAARLRVVRTQTSGAEPSVHAHYLYDGSGRRVKKLVRKQGGQVEITVYVEALFEHHRLIQGETPQENNTLHVMDDQRRLALVRIGLPFAGETTPAVQYHLGDHLGSSNVVVDASGALVNREEYTPYGETSFGSFAKKRYRYTGKERDEESGLSYHGARYYAPWLGRWVSCDPAGMVDGLNLYRYCRANPLRFVDPSGTQAQPAAAPEAKPADQGAAAGVDHAQLIHGAIEQVEADRLAQEESLANTGINVFFGNWSDFAKKSTREKKEWLKQNKKRGATAPAVDEMKGYGCVSWVMRVLEAGFKKAGAETEWADIRKTVASKNGYGTVLLKELQDRGWTILYLNKDVAENVTEKGYDSAYEWRLIRRDAVFKNYGGIKADDTITNFLPARGSKTTEDLSGIRKLEQVPFYVGIVEGGYHVFSGQNGDINDFHVNNNPNRKNTVDERPILEFFKGWHSGFVAVPPGYWPPK
jgi:RHS repeat-associated protein